MQSVAKKKTAIRMNLEEKLQAFMPGFISPVVGDESALWFIFDHGKLLTKIVGERCEIPGTADLEKTGLCPVDKQYLGSLGKHPCFGAAPEKGDVSIEGYQFKDLRSLIGLMPEDFIWIAGRANQLLHWHQSHRFCGGCGHPTEDKNDERAKICPRCGMLNYPRLSPAVIVAVLRDDRILLARNKRFRLPFYSVLAGYVEPLETLEDCVAREIREEVGIVVKNIRYFGSQPWPFPDSLMIAFVADYASGEITIDKREIVDAGWFTRYNIPEIPSGISIARRLIEGYVQNTL